MISLKIFADFDVIFMVDKRIEHRKWLSNCLFVCLLFFLITFTHEYTNQNINKSDTVLVLEREQKRDQAKSFLQDFYWSKSFGYSYTRKLFSRTNASLMSWSRLLCRASPSPSRQSVQLDVRAVCADVRLNFIAF